ncbi:hypothetical protein KJ359_011733 [Pestalotiopsis sp. 9143b]|nr:hypothetical protein KJ359_011733 [Pestalotiopsis sp. 9143b]
MVKLIALATIAIASLAAAAPALRGNNDAERQTPKRAEDPPAPWGRDIYPELADRDIEDRLAEPSRRESHARANEGTLARGPGRGRVRRGFSTRYRPAGNVGGSDHGHWHFGRDEADDSTKLVTKMVSPVNNFVSPVGESPSPSEPKEK